MSFTYLERALEQIPDNNQLFLKPGQKDLEEKFKEELKVYGPEINPIVKMKLISVFSMLVQRGLTTEAVNQMYREGMKYPLLSTIMMTVISIILFQKGVTQQQMNNNVGLLNELVFTDQEIDRLHLAITNH